MRQAVWVILLVIGFTGGILVRSWSGTSSVAPEAPMPPGPAAVSPAPPADSVAVSLPPLPPGALRGRPVSAAPLGPGEVESPTGRRPMTLWTGRWQARWVALAARQDRDWMAIERGAWASGTADTRYADLGQLATMAYQVTGNPSFAEKAWARIRRKLDKTPSDRNFTREHLLEYAWMYDWLKPALPEHQRRQYIEMMNRWCLLTLDRVPGVAFGTRTGDTDEVVGHYFGLALWALVSADENPQAMAYLRERPVGGLRATASDRSTWRNAIAQHVRKARGGVWLESSEYNLGTLRLLLVGAEAIRTATGRDDFPEVTALTDEIAAAQVHEVTSDLRQAYQWGDLQHPRSLQMDRRAPLLAVLTGLVRDEALAGQVLAFLNALPPGEIPPKEFILYNPFRPERPWTSRLLWYAAEGTGLVYARDTWDPRGSFFGAHMPRHLGVDHGVRYFGDFQLYRNGEWVVTHPLGYDTSDGELHNSMLIGGWSGMREAKGLLEAGAGAGGTVYAVGATGGSLYSQWDLAPSPPFLDEWTRAIVYVPSADRTSDIIVVHDRVLMQDPRTLPRYQAYHERDRRRMERELAGGLKQWILHMPEAPRQQGRTVSWRTMGGQPVTLISFWPEQVDVRIAQEGKDLGVSKYVKESERGWQVRLSSPRAGWETFLNVIHVGHGLASITPVREGSLEGVQIERPGHEARTVLFNAEPAKPLPGGGLAIPGLQHRKGLLDRFRRPNAVVIR